MEISSSSSKMEIMKPFLLKAGIPLALALSGFVIVKITTRKASHPPSHHQVNNQETDSSEIHKNEEDDHTYNAEAYYHSNNNNNNALEEILGLRSRIQEMQDREWQLEKRFLHYQELKDQEMVLIELQNKLLLETNVAEFMGREVSLMEAENQRFEDITFEFSKVLRLLQYSRSQNKQLHKRVEKLMRKTKLHSRILRKQKTLIESKETEILRNKEELEVKDDSIRELKLSNELLQGENNELSYKLKGEGKMVSVEDYNELARELERVERDEAAEVTELIYLRWCNACLKHELMRKNQDQEQRQTGELIQEFGTDNEISRSIVAQSDESNHHRHSKKRKLIAKFKRWVDGSEKTSKQKYLIEQKQQQNKC